VGGWRRGGVAIQCSTELSVKSGRHLSCRARRRRRGAAVRLRAGVGAADRAEGTAAGWSKSCAGHGAPHGNDTSGPGHVSSRMDPTTGASSMCAPRTRTAVGAASSNGPTISLPPTEVSRHRADVLDGGMLSHAVVVPPLGMITIAGGHGQGRASQAPSHTRGGGGGGGGNCFKCGEAGHYSNACPNNGGGRGGGASRTVWDG
jgi:hypothetical protein